MLTRLPKILLSSSVLVVPFLYLEYPLDPDTTPRFLLLSIVLLVSAVSMLMFAMRRPADFDGSFIRRAVFPVLIGYMLISLISLVQARVASDSMFDILKIVIFIAVVLIMTQLLNEARDYLIKLTKAIAVVGAGLSLIAILQYFDLGFRWIPGNTIPYGTMANKNLLSSFLFLTLPFTLHCLMTADRRWRAISAISAMTSLYAIFISQTRTVWLALAVATIMTVILAVALRSSDKQRAIRALTGPRGLALLSVAVLVAFIASVVTIAIHKSERIESDSVLPINVSDASLKERLALWDKSVSMFADNPVLGTGVGDWKIEITRYGTGRLPSGTGQVFFQRPHNDFLWVLAETGPLGLLLYVSIFLIAFYYCLSSIRTAASSSDIRLCILILFGLIGFAVISSFSFPKERIAHMVLVALMLAVSISVYHRMNPPKKRHSAVYIAALIASLPCLLLCIAVGIFRFNSEMHTKNAMLAKAKGDWKTVISEIDYAVSPFSVFDATSTPLVWYRGVANFNLNDIEAARKDFQKAYDLNPYHIHVLNNLASCYETQGDHDSALVYYNKALEIIPRFEETLVNLAAVYYNTGDYRKAHESLMQIDGKPTDPRYNLFMQRITDKLEGSTHP